MTIKQTRPFRKLVNVNLAFFTFTFFGTYVASFIFFVLPLEIPPILFNLFIVIVALPSLYFFSKWAGMKNTSLIIPILAVLVLGVEGIGILTGIPYGHFFYTNLMGMKLFGLVPWAIIFAFIPLLLGTLTIATMLTQQPWKLVLISAFLLVIVDLVIDPILVYLGIWIWITPGFYYGVPLSNFIGWFFMGIVASSISLLYLKLRVNAIPRLPIFVAISLVFTIGFWSGFALWAMLVVPFIISLVLLGLFLVTFLRISYPDHDRPDREVLAN